MRFFIRNDQSAFPEPILGPPGHELECFIPDGIKWRQINYGQGEGQVEVQGNEWGFYSYNALGMDVILHTGQVQPETAFAFVQDVGGKIAGRKFGFTVLLIGDEHDS